MIWFGIIIVPYILIILIGWYYLGKRDSIDKIHKIELTDTSLPLLTIIVPLKDEEKSLSSIITDLQNQDYPDKKIEEKLSKTTPSDPFIFTDK